MIVPFVWMSATGPERQEESVQRENSRRALEGRTAQRAARHAGDTSAASKVMFLVRNKVPAAAKVYGSLIAPTANKENENFESQRGLRAQGTCIASNESAVVFLVIYSVS